MQYTKFKHTSCQVCNTIVGQPASVPRRLDPIANVIQQQTFVVVRTA